MQEPISSYPLRWIGFATAALVFVGIVLLSLNVRSVADAVDSRVLSRDATSLEQGIYLLGELGASEQLGITRWDEAFEKVVQAPSQEWMRANLGRAAYPVPEEHRLVVIDGEGRVAFASDADGPLSPEDGERIVASSAPLLDRVGQAYSEALADGNRFTSRAPKALSQGIYGHDVAIVDGQPALIVASPFVPDRRATPRPPRPTFLLDIRPITPDFLARLGRVANLDGVRWAGETGSRRPGPIRPLLSASGATVGVISWDHDPPGAAVLSSAAPALALSVLFVAVIALLIAVRVKRTAKALAQSERSALYASRHDGVTGLVNRMWFMHELHRVAADQSAGPAAVALIDVDYFKAINDTLGHAAGDAVLVAAAQRLREFAGGACIPARFGGDEFAVIIPRLSSPAALPRLIGDLSASLSQPVDFEGQSIPVAVSIGAVSFTPGPEAEEKMLLPRADLALYRAKRDGRACWRLYDPAFDIPRETPVTPELLKQGRRYRVA